MPSENDWQRFAERSRNDGLVAGFVTPEGFGIRSTTYQLPPVSSEQQVGVFGPVTHLESTSLTGDITVGSSESRVARDQRLIVDSTAGVDAGRYRLTPLISAGGPTDVATLSGTAKVRVQGRALTRVPYLPWLIGALGAAIVGLVAEGIIRWVRGPQHS